MRAGSELLAAAKDADYEISMMLAAGVRAVQPADPVSRNLAVESFCQHLRNVIDFLWEPSNASSDDVLALHFVVDPATWQATRPQKDGELADAKRRINKLGAHLTYSRANVSKKWNVSMLLDCIVPALLSFKANLPPERIAWFPNLAALEREWTNRKTLAGAQV